MSEHGARVGGHEKFAVPDSEQHGRAAPGDDDLPGVRLGDYRDPVGPLDVVEGGDDALLVRLALAFFDQVRQRLCVRLGGATVTRPLEARARNARVLVDTVLLPCERYA